MTFNDGAAVNIRSIIMSAMSQENFDDTVNSKVWSMLGTNVAVIRLCKLRVNDDASQIQTDLP
jgi:hypothetical protein